MRFTRLLATGATAAVLGATLAATLPAQAANGARVETQVANSGVRSAPPQLSLVQAAGGIKRSPVTWSWQSDGLDPSVTGFQIQARRNGGAYRTVKTVRGADVRRTVVRNLRKGSYWFRVRALNGSTAGPAKVAWARVRVRSRKLPVRYYTFSTRDLSQYGLVTTVRVMSDGTVHGIAITNGEWGALVGYLSKGRIKARIGYGYHPWRQATTGKWNNLQFKRQIRVKKSKTLSGHRLRSLFRQEIRAGIIPRH
jgi:hypothetical protein